MSAIKRWDCFDEVQKFRAPLLFTGELVVDAQPPSRGPTVRFAMQAIEAICHFIHPAACFHQSRIDQRIGFAA
tara:strand:+ start:348 stop:566 length:219 start_codon:yes stop_codon:yes gene_type:complete